MENFKAYFQNRKVLTEMPMAMLEDWFYGVEKFLGTVGLHATETTWKLLHNFDKNVFKTEKDLELRQCKNSFMLGFKDLDYEYNKDLKEPYNVPEERFKVVMRMDLIDFSNFENAFNVKNLIKVDSVAVLEEFREKKIAITIYKFLVDKLHYTIMSDGVQYNGARKLWNKLSNDSILVVDVVDLETDKIIGSGIQLNHGKFTEEFNKEYWSLDLDKENIRFILKKVK